MHTVDDSLVVGLFKTSKQAEAAYQKLHGLGVSPEDFEVGAPEPGRYHLEDRGSQEIGQGVATGVAIGIPVGGLVSVGVLMLAVPGYANEGVGGIALGLLIGAFWGIFFGGLGGIVPKILAHADEDSWCQISADGPEMLMAVHAGAQSAIVRDTMRRQGARFFEGESPAVQPHPGAFAVAG